jgi:hypothetical protein
VPKLQSKTAVEALLAGGLPWVNVGSCWKVITAFSPRFEREFNPCFGMVLFVVGAELHGHA